MRSTASRHGLGALLADASPVTGHGWTGLIAGDSQSLYAPLAVAAVVALMFVLARCLARLGCAQRRAAAPWLCGYASEAEIYRYRPSGFYGELTRLLDRLGIARRPAGPRPGRRRDGEEGTLRMIARDKLNLLKDKFGPAILRADLPADGRLFVCGRTGRHPRHLPVFVRRPRRALHHQHRLGRPAILGEIPRRAQFRFRRGESARQRAGSSACRKPKARQHHRRGACRELGGARNPRHGRRGV